MTDTSTDSRPSDDGALDERPRFGIGHVSLDVADVDRVAEFYESVGMRLVVNMGRMAILELRGGTHLVLAAGGAGGGALDLIVDDIDETRSLMEAAGAQPGSITRGSPHDRFTATDPEGNRLVVASNHAVGPV
ncbi:MAG: VOC family protein [Actinomycetota bacterium]